MIQINRKERRRIAKRMAKAANVFKKNVRRAWGWCNTVPGRRRMKSKRLYWFSMVNRIKSVEKAGPSSKQVKTWRNPMPNLDEKCAFEHGIIAISKLLEVFAREKFKDNDGVAYIIQELALGIGDSVPELSECYAQNGFEKTIERMDRLRLPIEEEMENGRTF